MAYQPKSYRKFLATGVATAMVATTVAPAVSADQHTDFTDIEDVRSWAGDAIDYLVEKGAIQGMGTPGIFNPQGNLTRGQAASLLANTLGLDVDEDATSGFDDLAGHWSDAYVAAIQAELPGVIDGYTDGTFRPENNITRQEMSKITVEAFDLEVNADADVDFSDNSSWGAEYVEVLASLGILGGYTDGTIRPEADITRAEAAVFVHRTEVPEVRLGQDEVTEVGITSVSAINTRTLAVEFNQAIDTDEAEFEVKRGSVTSNIADVSFNDDNTVAHIELASRISEGEYTVNVSGLTDEVLSATYEAENERVDNIEISSDIAVLNSTGNGATVGYTVYNQYGEDITRSTSLNESVSRGSASVDAANSRVNLDFSGLSTMPESGDTVTLSLVHAATGTSEVKTLTVSDASQVTDVSIDGLYVEDDRTLTEDETSVDEFWLLVDAKDQYGNSMDASAATSDLLVTVSNPNVVTVNGYNASNNSATFSNETIDGEERLVLKLDGPSPLDRSGESNIRLISKFTGNSSNYTVQVAEGLKLNTLNMSQPEFPVAGETVEIPFSATDAYGEDLTNFAALTNGVTSWSVSGGGTGYTDPYFEVDSNGNTVLKFDIPADSDGNVVITATTESQQFSSLTFNAREEAEAVAITGLHDDVYRNVLEGEDLTIETTDLVAEDQYGRSQSGNWLAGKLGDTTSPGSDLFVQVEDANTAGGAISNPSNSILGSTGDTSTVITGDNRGTENLVFTLVEADGAGSYNEVAGSDFSQQMRTVRLSDIEDYEINEIPMMFDTPDGAYTHEVEVDGLLSNGSKVFIPQTSAASDTLYNLTTNSQYLIPSGATLDANSDDGSGGFLLPYGDGSEVTLRATVTINHTGESFREDVVVSKADPTIEEVAYDITNALVTEEFEDGTFNVAGTVATVGNGSNHFSLLIVTDQYGVDATGVTAGGIVDFADGTSTSNPAIITFSNVQNISGGTAPTITNNGTLNAALSNLSASDIFTTTITFPDGQQTSARVIAQ